MFASFSPLKTYRAALAISDVFMYTFSARAACRRSPEAGRGLTLLVADSKTGYYGVHLAAPLERLYYRAIPAGLPILVLAQINSELCTSPILAGPSPIRRV